MTIKPIHTETDHAAALARIEALMETDPAPGTTDGDELDILTTLVAAYEDATLPAAAPDPVEAIRFFMEQRGLKQSDFAELIGKSRASEVLSHKRPLSMNQARVLHKVWGVPAEALLA